MKLILIFSLSQYLQNIIISTCNPHKNHNEMFNIFSTKYRKFSVYFVLPAHLNLWESHFKHSQLHVAGSHQAVYTGLGGYGCCPLNVPLATGHGSLAPFKSWSQQLATTTLDCL